MIKFEQRGFTILELLISIAIIGVIAPLLALALFQTLTFTEKGRAGFQAQAGTRIAAAWISQDVVMAQKASHDASDFSFDTANLAPDTSILHTSFMCSEQTAVTFAWTDYFNDRELDHWVSYCWQDNDAEQQCLPDNPCLIRTYDGVSNIIGRHIESVSFARDATGKQITVTIISDPDDRFGVFDKKTFKVLMRPTI